jgi:hypothetical protein
MLGPRASGVAYLNLREIGKKTQAMLWRSRNRINRQFDDFLDCAPKDMYRLPI